MKIVTSDAVSISSLLADKYCDAEATQFIYYLNAGELLSRTIHYKDTHSPRGDLLVVYTEQEHLQEAGSATNGEATAAVLGFTPPSFTRGADIVLPSIVNQQLRDVLIRSHGSKEDQGEAGDDDYAARLLSGFSDVSVQQVSKSTMMIVNRSTLRCMHGIVRGVVVRYFFY